MADIRKLAPLILKWEGLFVDDPADAGGPTHMGVTLKRLIEAEFDKNKDGLVNIDDLKALNEHDVIYCFLKPFYWDRWQADHIRNQSIANLLVDWVWMSGKAGINIPQKVLGVKVDGIVGNQTLQAVNEHPNPELLFEKLKSERKLFIERICKARPANNRFRKGWLNRLADFKFVCVLLLLVVSLSCGGCKSTAQLGTTTTQDNSSSNTHLQQSEQVTSNANSINATNLSWEEMMVITSDSMTDIQKLIPGGLLDQAKLIYVRKINKQTESTNNQSRGMELTASLNQEISTETLQKMELVPVKKNEKISNLRMIFFLSLVFGFLFCYAYQKIKSFIQP